MANKSVGFLTVAFGADLRGFDRAMKKANRSIKKFGSNMKRIGGNMTRNITLPVIGLGAASIKAASDLEETRSKFNTVFSSIQNDAQNTAKEFKESFGLSSQAALGMLSDTGDLLVGFGFTEREALNLSKQVNELAVDLASFTNFSGGADGASQALTKALLGEREAIKSLGIAITEADLKRFAEEQGLVFKELDRVAKAQLTFELAVSQSQKAIGDFARTQGGFANQLRILKGEFNDLAAELGTMLLPLAQKLVDAFRKMFEFLSKLSPEFKNNALNITLLVSAIGPIVFAVGTISTALAAVFSATGMVVLGLGAIVAAFLFVRENYEALKERLSDWTWWRNALIDAVQFFIQDFFGRIVKRFNELREFLGKDPIPNPFADLIDELEGLKKETNDYEHQFKSFGDSMKNQAKEIADALGILSNPFQLATTGTPSVGPIHGPKTFAQHIADQNALFASLFPNLDKVKEKTNEMSLAAASFGDILRDSMNQALDGTQSFAKAFMESVNQMIKRLLVQLAVMTAIQILFGGVSASKALSVAGLKANLGKITGMSFANGGIISGPTLGLMGEYAGANSNPEVVAPLSKLKSMIGGGTQQVEVVGRISGTDIFLSNARTSGNRLRSV